jgi:hypothetical protein
MRTHPRSPRSLTIDDETGITIAAVQIKGNLFGPRIFRNLLAKLLSAKADLLPIIHLSRASVEVLTSARCEPRFAPSREEDVGGGETTCIEIGYEMCFKLMEGVVKERIVRWSFAA